MNKMKTTCPYYFRQSKVFRTYSDRMGIGPIYCVFYHDNSFTVFLFRLYALDCRGNSVSKSLKEIRGELHFGSP